jgi:hypothetical protein
MLPDAMKTGERGRKPEIFKRNLEFQIWKSGNLKSEKSLARPAREPNWATGSTAAAGISSRP